MRNFFIIINISIFFLISPNMIFGMWEHSSAIDLSPDEIAHIKNHVKAMDNDVDLLDHGLSRNFNTQEPKRRAGSIFEEKRNWVLIVFKNLESRETEPGDLVFHEKFGGKVYSGYYALYESLRSSLRRSLSPFLSSKDRQSCELIFTGFRLGATLATFAID